MFAGQKSVGLKVALVAALVLGDLAVGEMMGGGSGNVSVRVGVRAGMPGPEMGGYGSHGGGGQGCEQGGGEGFGRGGHFGRKKRRHGRRFSKHGFKGRGGGASVKVGVRVRF